MTLVLQTRFGDKTGNCFQAAVATLLSLNLDDVPDFCQAGDDKWFDDFQEWLSRRGMCATIVQCESDDEFRMIAPNGACLVGGTSPRGFDHAVVYLDGKLFHDPHPDGGGLTSLSDIIVVWPLSWDEWSRRPQEVPAPPAK